MIISLRTVMKFIKGLADLLLPLTPSTSISKNYFNKVEHISIRNQFEYEIVIGILSHQMKIFNNSNIFLFSTRLSTRRVTERCE